MKYYLLAVFILFFLFVHNNIFAGDGPGRWTPEYMMQFKRVANPEISPDGKWIAYTVSEPRMNGERSDFLTHIHITSADGEVQYQLTRGMESAIQPQWSPDGAYIAFLSTRGGDGNQLWRIRRDGGEAQRITRIEGGVIWYSWSPDGSYIAFTRADPESKEQKRKRDEGRYVRVVDTNYRYAHLYTIATEKNENGDRPVKRLTRGDFNVRYFDWSPDGRHIVFEHMPTPKINEWVNINISIVPSDSGETLLLVDWDGSNSLPVFSPDGERIAFVSDSGNTRWAYAGDLYTISRDGSDPKRLAKTFDRRPGFLRWSIDGKRLFYVEFHRTSSRLFSIPVDGGNYDIITTGSGVYQGATLSKDETVVAAIHEDFDTPPDVIISDVGDFYPKRLTNVNEGYQKYPAGKGEVIRYTTPDGLEIEAPLIYPVDYEEGHRYPLIMIPHGGPAGVSPEMYTASSSIHPLPAFAAEGYFVLRPNFRGSTGYGKEFRFANINDWGYGDLDDMVAGIDYLIEQGMVDPDRLAIMGYSYGGYIAAFAVTRTDRFRAAIVGAGITNLISMAGTTDIDGFVTDYFESEIWENTEVYIRHSPIFHVENITTPTLIIHPEEDARVPASQGWELYTALKRRGVETQLLLYPGQPHAIGNPKYIQDIGERYIQWLNKYVRDVDLR